LLVILAIATTPLTLIVRHGSRDRQGVSQIVMDPFTERPEVADLKTSVVHAAA
jgi:hypothetical protein